MAATPPVVRLLRLRGSPILDQLWLEEGLLRAHSGNWCVINDGAARPAIVLGISGKPALLADVEAAHAAGVPLIKRFTGGGTVVVDADTIFTSLIVHGPSALPQVACYPRPIMQWTEGLFAAALRQAQATPAQPTSLAPSSPGDDAPRFRLRENDYVFGGRKFGGNAQAISRDRWLHHTSLLWDFDPARMALLRHPEKAPEYRGGRGHLDFVMRLREVCTSREGLIEALCRGLEGAGFAVVEGDVAEAEAAAERNELRGTRALHPSEYLPSWQQQQQAVGAVGERA